MNQLIWIQSDKQTSEREILKVKRTGDKFSVTVGFYNNTKEELKPLHDGFTWCLAHKFQWSFGSKYEETNCTDAIAFIEKVCENYKNLLAKNWTLKPSITGIFRGASKEQHFQSSFAFYFNGYRDKLDTEKAIYRLSTP